MDLSIVIPTYNRARLLPTTVAALAAQETTPDDSYEVIFVSNGFTDGTDSLLLETCSRHPSIFRYFRIDPTGGPSAPRNFGIRAAQGEILIILDDDVLPEPTLVRSHAEFHKRYPDRRHAAIGDAYVPSL